MMKIFNLKILGGLILLTFLIFTVARFYLLLDDYQQKLSTSSIEYKKAKIAIETYKYIFKNQILNEGVRMPDSISLVNIKNKKQASIKMLVDKKTLFFRISDKSCDLCIKQEFKNLKDFSNSTGFKNIKIIASFKDIRTLHFLIKDNNVPFSTFKLNEGTIDFIPLENQDLPYFFILDETLVLNAVFVPTKELPYLSSEYFNAMLEKLI